MSNSMIDIMKMDGLQDLYSGCVSALDREILSKTPLPSDMVDPFASEEVDPLQMMNLTCVSLSS